MSELHRSSAGLVWLKHLLETLGHEPTARGMHAARPSVTACASVTDLAPFARLSRLVACGRDDQRTMSNAGAIDASGTQNAGSVGAGRSTHGTVAVTDDLGIPFYTLVIRPCGCDAT